MCYDEKSTGREIWQICKGELIWTFKKVEQNRIIKTIIAMGILLLAFFIQGAVVAIKGFEGIKSAVVRGFVLWGLVGLTIAFYCIKRKRLSVPGFCKTKYIFIKELHYFIPLIVIPSFRFFVG